MRRGEPSGGFDTTVLSLKKRYWSLLETARSYRRGIRDVAVDISEQVKVLAVFVWYVALGKQGSEGNSERAVLSETQRKTLLMISYYAPPYTAAYGTERVAKLAKYLSRSGWQITLLASQPEDSSKIDTTSDSIPENVDIIRVPGKTLKALADKNFIVPDDFIGWVIPAVAEARKVIQEKKPAVICATAPPYSNLLVGAICSRMFHIPLVSDFRDPWSRIDIVWKIERPILRTINQFLEKQILKVSRKVVMADEKRYCSEYFIEGSGLRDKIESITNGFDEEEFADLSPSSARSDRDKFVITYVGGFYDYEAFLNLVRPLELWQKAYPGDFEKVVFEYAGQSSNYFANHSLCFDLRLRGYLSHQEAIELRFRSDLQMFTQPTHFKLHVLSGKIFEMIRVGVPIVAFTNPEGAVADLIRRTKTGFLVRSGDHEAGARVLKEIFAKWQRREKAVEPDQSAIMEFRRDKLAKRFSDLLENVILQSQSHPPVS